MGRFIAALILSVALAPSVTATAATSDPPPVTTPGLCEAFPWLPGCR